MLVHQVLESNQEMAQRLANLRMRSSVASSKCSSIIAGKEIDDDTLTIKPGRPSDGGELNLDIDQTMSLGFAFEQDLQSSRVYQRTLVRDSESLLSSSFDRSIGWSLLSGLSFTDVSGLSIISLPISRQEIWNWSYYAPEHGQTDYFTSGSEEVGDFPLGSPGAFASEDTLVPSEITNSLSRSLNNLGDVPHLCKGCDKVQLKTIL